MAFLAGQTLTAGALNLATRRVFARADRSSSSAPTTTTELGVLRLDDVPLLAGRGYWIRTSNLLLISTVTTDSVAARLRFTTAGSTPNTASPILSALLADVTPSAGQLRTSMQRYYVPTGAETLSVLLTIQRAAGTGSVSIGFAQGLPIDILVEDAGDDPGDGGTDL